MKSLYITIMAIILFFCILLHLTQNEKQELLSEIDRLKAERLVDCRFKDGRHSHKWINACLIHDNYVEVIR